MRAMKKIQNVVDWGLCVGCGACYYYCQKGAVCLKDIKYLGIRPLFQEEICSQCNECLAICPGYAVDAYSRINGEGSLYDNNPLIGRSLEVWEGYARDKDIRYRASSGGIISAIALYCLEKEGMPLVLHTGMHPTMPWTNRTIVSKNRNDLLGNCGSRYAPSSPCDSLALIEQSEKPCVFIGKPCDTAAVSLLRRMRPALHEKLGLVLTFFCAGTPCTQGTLDLLEQLDIPHGKVRQIRYRGNGWPGKFSVTLTESTASKRELTYHEAWGFLQKYRPYRCHLCPDSTGEFADIASGDPWYREIKEDEEGHSLVLVRTQKGRNIVNASIVHGYMHGVLTDTCVLKKSQQNLLNKRAAVWGRIIAFRLMGLPAPRYVGFPLFTNWLTLPVSAKVRSVAGTIKRIIERKYWHPLRLNI